MLFTMNKRYLFLIMLFLAVVTTGCTETGGGNLSDPSADVNKEEQQSELSGTITVLTNRIDLIENGVYKQYASAFMEQYPGAKVEFEGISDYSKDVVVRLSTRDTGDVLLMPLSVPNKDLPNYFEPLDDDMFDNIRFADHKSYEGKRYGIVTGSSTMGIVYNKQAFAQAGITEIPTTLDAFFETAEKLKASGITPIYLNYGAKWPNQQWGENLVSYRTGSADYLNNMVHDDEPWQMDNPWGESIMIAKRLIDLGYVEEELFTNNWEISKSELASGKVAMYFLGNWVIQQVVDAGADPDNLGFFPFPYDNGSKHYAPLNSDWFIGVSKFSSNKELAKAWINFFVKESGYVDDSGYLPIDTTKTSSLPQIKEFLSYDPILIESVQQSDRFIDIANQAGISFWLGELAQELIAAPNLQEAFDNLNSKWSEARKHIEVR